MNTISAQSFSNIMEEKDIVILDVRSEGEFKQYHLDNAINIPYDQIDKRYTELNKDDNIFVYCNAGVKSMMVLEFLKTKDINVTNVNGGLIELSYANKK